MLFSLLQAPCLGKLNPRARLTAYLAACAAAGGAAPADGERLLPWTLRAEQRRCWSLAGTEPDGDTS